MALHAQASPVVFVGDTIDDLPDPSNVPEGHRFQDISTGKIFVLAIDTKTGIHQWVIKPRGRCCR